MLIDQFAPRYDFVRTSHQLVDADPEATYRAVRDLDFTEVHGSVVDLSIWARGIPERMRARRHGPPRVPTRLTLGDLAAGSEWVILGEQPGIELVFGAVGRFWKPVIEWRTIEPRDFADFAEHGWGKIACSLSTIPYGRNRTLLTYDVRTILDDPRTWVSFRRYWRVIAPFVGAIERATLRTIASAAQQGGGR